MRKALIGIRVKPFTEGPILEINDWKIYDAGRVTLLPPEDRLLNENYQIERGENEKILVRIFLSHDRATIEKTKYYYLIKNTDEESALFLSLALLKRLPYHLNPNHELLPFGF